MTSVAYRVEPPSPGWLWAAAGLVAGWIFGWLVIGLLYALAELVGAIGRTYPSYPHGLNDWPYSDNGLWSLAANVAVVALILVLTTVVTAWWLRRSYDQFSEGRLALVLLITGWLPLVTGGPVGGFFGFLVALFLIRNWVTRDQDYLPRRTVAICVAALAGVIMAYGLLHPLWTVDVEPSFPARGGPATIVIHNAARVALRVDGFTVTPFLGEATKSEATPFPTHPAPRHRAFRFPARSDRFLFQPLPRGGCGDLPLRIHVRYHVFGLALHQTVPAQVSLGHRC